MILNLSIRLKTYKCVLQQLVGRVLIESLAYTTMIGACLEIDKVVFNYVYI
jgi:hypothetical protein